MLFHLRNNYTLYATAPDYGNIGSTNGVAECRRMKLHDGSGRYVISIANLDPNNSQVVTPGYDVAGQWYRYNGDPGFDGSTFNVNATSDSYTLAPSESMILTNFDIGWTDDCDDVDACCVGRIFTWTGGIGDWHTPANWDQNDLPQSCDLVIIPSGGTVTIANGNTGYAYEVITENGASLIITGDLEVAR